MQRILLLSLLFSLLFACKKVENPEVLNQVKGDYEWYYSYGGLTFSESFDTHENQYGIRIEENGKVKFFTNGSKVKTYRVINVYEAPSGLIELQSENGSEQIHLAIEGDTLRSDTAPFEGKTNYYSKKS